MFLRFIHDDVIARVHLFSMLYNNSLCKYRVGQIRFTVLHMENNALSNNARITSVFCIFTTVNLLLPHSVYGKWFIHFPSSGHLSCLWSFVVSSTAAGNVFVHAFWCTWASFWKYVTGGVIAGSLNLLKSSFLKGSAKSFSSTKLYQFILLSCV